MFDILKSELLPRRKSSQYCFIEKKKIERLLKWVNLEKLTKKIKEIVLEFHLKSPDCFFPIKSWIPVSHHIRVQSKKFYIIISDSYRNLEKKGNKLSKLESVGHIINFNSFFKKNSSKRNDFLLFPKPKIVLVDKNLSLNQINLLNNIFKKQKISFFLINLKNEIILEILKKSSIFISKSNNFSNRLINISAKNCKKIVSNNIFNLAGGILERMFLKGNKVSRIIVKTRLLPALNVYFEEKVIC